MCVWVQNEDLARFEAPAGDMLEELGYERGVPSPRPEAVEHAARIREQFTRDAVARKRVMPEGW
jgi:hypothetical protein